MKTLKAKATHKKEIKRRQRTQPLQFLFGIREAQRSFSRRHQPLLKEYGNLRAAEDFVISKATRTMKNDMKDKIIYFLARQVFEDFDEILILCGNGKSTGALKILRGMFERTVTLCYLQKHPEEIDRYHKYFYVRRRKETNSLKQDFPGSLSGELLARFKKEYEEVKSMFQVPRCEVCKVEDCKPCSKLRDHHNWSRKDIIQLAREAGNFDSVIWIGYYVPMQESHPTAQAIVHRVTFSKKDKWNYIEGPKPEMDRHTFIVAHFLVVRAVEALAMQINLDIETKLQELWKVYMAILQRYKRNQKRRAPNPRSDANATYRGSQTLKGRYPESKFSVQI
jgi:hypothetical protein